MPERSQNANRAAGFRLVRGAVIATLLTLGLTALAFGPRLGGYLSAILHADIRPQVPDFSPLVEAGPIIQLHLVGALLALAIGTVLLIGVKGTTTHRVLGWTWVLAMAATALSSVFIRDLNHGSFSLIHLLTGWTLIILPMAVFMARTRRVAVHRRMMTGLFVGGLIIAGVFAFLPGRLLFSVFFAT
jgi:uncharacterized membrane protein